MFEKKQDPLLLPSQTVQQGGDAEPSPLHHDPRNPYKGLRAFGESDSKDFFGRRTLVERLLGRLLGSERTEQVPFLVVVGPSGSGKSSVVRAGLIPALHEREGSDSSPWLVTEMVPGNQPLEELEFALRWVCNGLDDDLYEQLFTHDDALLNILRCRNHRDPTQSAARLLLFIDQFEEAFTLCHDEAIRARFFNNIVQAVCAPGSSLWVVVALRADFYHLPLRYEQLARLMQQQTEIVVPLSADELEEAITAPSAGVGVAVEPELVRSILLDVADQPGMLPLLQYTLMELFEQQEGRTLTRHVYLANGGVTGTLTRRAEELYHSLSHNQQEETRRLFLRLITPGEGVPDTRRRVRLSEMLQAQAHLSDTMCLLTGSEPYRVFGRYRLLTFDQDPVTSEPTLELAHEALISHWARLREWVDTHREHLHIHRALTRAAQEWERLERDTGALYRGAQLAIALEWAQTAGSELNPLEQGFLATSREAEEAVERQREETRQRELAQAQALAEEQHRRLEIEQERAEEQEAATRRLKRRAFWLAFSGIGVVLAAILAFFFGIQAQQQQSTLQGMVLESAAQVEYRRGNPDLALSLALQAVQVEVPAWSAQATLSEIAYDSRTRRRFGGSIGPVNAIAVSPDGKTLLSGSLDGSVCLWDIQSGKEIRRFVGHTETVQTVVFSPDGRTAATGSGDTTVRLWDVSTGQELRRFEGHTGDILAIAISPDGKTILSASGDKTLRLWDMATGRELRQFVGHTALVWDVAFSPDGTRALSGSLDNSVRLWNVQTGQQIHLFGPLAATVRSVAFSPDGATVYAGTSAGILFLWDTERGEAGIPIEIHAGPINSITFSHDGHLLLCATGNNTIDIVDIDTRQQIHRFSGHTDQVTGAVFSPDERFILSGSLDKTIRLWDVQSGAQLQQFENHKGAVMHLDVNSDGRLILSASMDGSISLWDVAQNRLLQRLDQHKGPVMGVAFSADGNYAISGSADTTVRMWKMTDNPDEPLQQTRVLTGHTLPVWGVAFSPDGRKLLSGSSDTTVRVWDVQTGKQERLFDAGDAWVTNVAFSPDGIIAAASVMDGKVRMWDVECAQELHPLIGHTGAVMQIAFSPDGKWLLSGSADRTLRLWDVATGKEIRRFEGHLGSITAVAFSPDGRTAISGSMDSTARLWDIATGQELRVLSGHTDWVRTVSFSPDGKQVLTGSFDRTIRVWRFDDTMDKLVAWTRANRYIPELPEDVRQQYGLSQ